MHRLIRWTVTCGYVLWPSHSFEWAAVLAYLRTVHDKIINKQQQPSMSEEWLCNGSTLFREPNISDAHHSIFAGKTASVFADIISLRRNLATLHIVVFHTLYVFIKVTKILTSTERAGDTNGAQNDWAIEWSSEWPGHRWKDPTTTTQVAKWGVNKATNDWVSFVSNTNKNVNAVNWRDSWLDVWLAFKGSWAASLWPHNIKILSSC